MKMQMKKERRGGREGKRKQLERSGITFKEVAFLSDRWHMKNNSERQWTVEPLQVSLKKPTN